MKRYTTLLFDLDGTLVDSYQALATALNRVAGFSQRERYDIETVKGMVGEGVDRLLQRAFDVEQVDAELRASFERCYDEVCCSESHILEMVEETLATLAAARIPMGVCTNKPTSFSTKILQHLGLARHFAAIVGPDRAGAQKPDRRHLITTLTLVGGEPASALFVGDMPIDIAAARASGIDVAVVATGSASAAELELERPDYMLQSFAELLEIVTPGTYA
jgi:phosphoglycolate phosphatase